MLSVVQSRSWAAEWHVIVIFHNCQFHFAFFCCLFAVLGGASALLYPELPISSLCQRFSHDGSPVILFVPRLRGLGAPGGNDWLSEVGTSQCFGELLASSPGCAEH